MEHIWSPILTGLFLWLGLNWVSEAHQEDPGRMKPPTWLVVGTVALSMAAASCASRAAGWWAFIHYAFVLVYAAKKRSAFLGLVSSGSRGLTVFAGCACLASAASGRFWPTDNALWFAIFLALTHSCRNLVGDIRDSETDRYELPAVAGIKASVLVCFAWLVCAAAAAQFIAHQELRWVSEVFIILVAASLYWLCKSIPAKGVRLAGRDLHQRLVFGFAAFCLICSGLEGLCIAALIPLTLLLALLHPTYRLTPGKEYGDKPPAPTAVL